MDFEKYIRNIEDKLRSNFDLHREYDLNGEILDLFAEFHVRSERYVLTKKAKIYGMENNEYCIFKKHKNLSGYELEKFNEFLINSIDTLIQPHNEHMSTMITGVIIFDGSRKNIDDDVIENIKKFKFHKGFSFGFKGWVDIRIVLVCLEDKFLITSKRGDEVSKVYEVME